MNKSLMRAVLVACLPFCAMSLAIVANPAMAADKDDKAAAAEAPKASKAGSKVISEAKKALDAKDYKTAVEKCNEGLKLPDLTDADRYYLNRFLGVAAFSTGDRETSRKAFIDVIKNPATPASDRQYLIGPTISLAAEANDNPGVIELAKMAIADNIANPEVYARLAAAYYQTNDFPNAISYAQKGIDGSVAGGKIPEYGLYQILAFSYDKQKNRPQEVKAFEQMARDYGKPDDWGYLLDFSLEILPAGNKTAREIAALDIYRLRMTVGASWQAQNYLEAEDAAHAIRSWGDAKQVLEIGIAKGAINRAKIGPTLAQVTSDAKKDEPILPTVEKSAKSSKDLANVAEAYYGYQRYADAARVAQKAIDAGGSAVAEAKLVLAMAQVKQGNEAAAKQTLANFQGDPALARAAELWNIYLNRRTQAAAAAPATH